MMRRVAPSPASIRYGTPFTTSRFDDCARPARGSGPPPVPSVTSTVPLAGGFAGCANAGAAAKASVQSARWMAFVMASPGLVRRQAYAPRRSARGARRTARVRQYAGKPRFPVGRAMARVVLWVAHRGGRRATTGGRMQLMVVFVVLLLVAIVAGICMMAERRSGRDRRRASRGGRRAADGSPAVVTPPLQMR